MKPYIKKVRAICENYMDLIGKLFYIEITKKKIWIIYKAYFGWKFVNKYCLLFLRYIVYLGI